MGLINGYKTSQRVVVSKVLVRGLFVSLWEQWREDTVINIIPGFGSVISNLSGSLEKMTFI